MQKYMLIIIREISVKEKREKNNRSKSMETWRNYFNILSSQELVKQM